jgi:hypothetical protein
MCSEFALAVWCGVSLDTYLMIGHGLQVRFSSHNHDAEAEVNEPGAEVTIPHEEYQALTRKAREVEELANKRVAMAMAQVMSR